VEIARAVSEDSLVLIMDEPTTSLSQREIDRMFLLVDDLRAKGMGIVFVPHGLEEVFRIADRITVLRDSKFIGTRPASELDHAKVIKMMVGRDVAEVTTRRRPGKAVLGLRISRIGVLQEYLVQHPRGRIVSANRPGRCRSKRGRGCIFGMDLYEEGGGRINGKVVARAILRCVIKRGRLARRQARSTLVAQLSVRVDTTRRAGLIAPQRVILKERENEIVRERKARSGLDGVTRLKFATLSGGNQRKVVLARWLARKPSLLIQTDQGWISVRRRKSARSSIASFRRNCNPPHQLPNCLKFSRSAIMYHAVRGS
jgi:ABC-type sugar transport system ATPase subunit